MFELNDIKGMQREVARCAELKELLDQGLHDEALGEVRSGEERSDELRRRVNWKSTNNGR